MYCGDVDKSFTINNMEAKMLWVGRGWGPYVNKFEQVQGARVAGSHVTYHMGPMMTPVL